jgi:hypothetical protein
MLQQKSERTEFDGGKPIGDATNGKTEIGIEVQAGFKTRRGDEGAQRDDIGRRRLGRSGLGP